MLRNKPLTSLQKSYDDCYLICSTAVYFEAQGNEIDALRSWRSALDLIYYHNAYRVPSRYIPKSNAEKTLQNSLRDIEIRCKEKIYHLEALKQSRKDDPTEKCFQRSDKTHRKTSSEIKKSNTEEGNCGKMDRNNSPVVNAPDTMKPVPLLPHHLSPMRNGSVNSATASTKSPSGPTQNHRASCSNINTRKVSAKSDPTLKEIIKISSSESRRKLKPTLRSSTRKGRIIPSRRGPKDENPVTSKAALLAWQSLGKSSKDFCRSNDDKGSTKIKVSSGQKNNRISFHYESDSALHSQLKSKSQSLVDNNFIDQNPRSILTESFHAEGVSSLSHGPSFQTRISRQSDSLLQGLKDFYPLMSSCTKSSVPKSAESIPQLNQSLKSRNRKDLSHPVHSSTTRVKVEIPTRRKVKVEDCSESVQVISNKSNGRFPSKKASLLQSHELNQEKYDNLILDKEATQNDKVQTQYQRLKNVNHSDTSETTEIMKQKQKLKRKQKLNPITVRLSTSESNLSELQTYSAKSDWEAKVKNLMKSLPKGINQAAAKQVLDEVVVKGDEVHWDDIAGLDIAKNALKEAVVYPFLRPDLFKGLREPARGMLLFGPPGTGKTMLARAVATESNSTFFSISASSLTSKYMGESEKLVRALFQLAKLLAPSIIFVDEIDSLLSARSGSGEHESSRRIKTEFFIQWSDLQRAAAGRAQHVKESEQGDASRVLVLAATNVPWIIDEAARRRFVRRQYIPLPEAKVRESQVRNLLSQQKHNLKEEDIHKLVDLTEGFSGSDITALAKDAAMGPLRSLGEAMLFMSMDEIRYINFADFEASLTSIRPSVSKESLEEFENWARVFGERGG